jgi:hypothetical protein
MAQAKTSKSRSTGGSSGKKTASGNSKARSTRASAKTKSKSRAGSSSRSRSGSSSSRSPQRRSSAQGSRRQTPKSQSKSTVAGIVEKAKGPALAGGAALMGIAGGVALTHRNKRGPLQKLKGSLPRPHVSAPKMDLSQSGKLVEGIGRAAGVVAERSEQVGRVAGDVRRASDAINGNS